jgi:RNA polymerase sigma-70 factor (ECF subfamily)
VAARKVPSRAGRAAGRPVIGNHGVRSPCDDHESRFALFYTQCFPKVSAALAVIAGDTRTVEDAAQEAFVLALHKWAKLATYDKPEAWVLKVALQKLRRLQRLRPEQSLEVSDVDTRSGLIADHADHVVLRDELHAAIRALPRRQAEVITLHDLCGYPAGDVGSILHIDDSTVRVHLARARQQLHRLLSRPDAGSPGEAP